MKKIIKGKKYDTETAEELFCEDSGGSTSDFNYWCERIFRKKTGEYFLFGEGHGFSIYATICGNSRGWGQAIRPLTDNDLKEWFIRHDLVDEYETIFGKVEE